MAKTLFVHLARSSQVDKWPKPPIGVWPDHVVHPPPTTSNTELSKITLLAVSGRARDQERSQPLTGGQEEKFASEPCSRGLSALQEALGH